MCHHPQINVSLSTSVCRCFFVGRGVRPDITLLLTLLCSSCFFFEPNKCLVTYDWLFVVWPVDLFCTIRCSPLSLLLRFSRHLYLPFLFPLFIRERVHKKTVGKKFNTLYNFFPYWVICFPFTKHSKCVKNNSSYDIRENISD